MGSEGGPEVPKLLQKSPEKYKGRSRGKMCAVVGCKNCYQMIYRWKNEICTIHCDRLHKHCSCLPPVRLFPFPKDPESISKWFKKLNCPVVPSSQNLVVCNIHFIDGKPTDKYPYPELNLGYENKQITKGRARRSNSKDDEVPRKKSKPSTVTSSDLQPPGPQTQLVVSPLPTPPTSVAANDPIQRTRTGHDDEDMHIDNSQQDLTASPNSPPLSSFSPSLAVHTPSPPSSTTGSDISSSSKRPGARKCPCQDCKLKPWRTGKVKDSVTQTQAPMGRRKSMGTQTSVIDGLTDELCLLYTGLKKEIFDSILEMCRGVGRRSGHLSIDDQVLLVMMRLKLGLIFEDLAQRFNISKQQAGKIFVFWIRRLANIFRDLIVWLPPDTVKDTMPANFRLRYPNVTTIIDCFEIFTQRPTQLLLRGQMYSYYKSHQTTKFLISIAPCGFITFISEGFSGRSSDKYVVKHSGYLDLLRPEIDNVMADRGFTIKDELDEKKVELVIPAFTKGKPQLSRKEVVSSRRIANVRIHVERAIRRIRSYRYLKYEIPLTCMKTLNDSVFVIAALCNLKNPLIKNNCSLL